MNRFMAALLVALPCLAAVPEHPLATLRKAHPRLIATTEDFARLQKLVVSEDSLARGIWAGLKRRADEIQNQPPVVHRLIGPACWTRAGCAWSASTRWRWSFA